MGDFMFKIGNVEINNSIGLAPMAGVSNPAYIKIVENMGCGFAVTELISAEAIVRGNKKTFEMLKGIDDVSIPVGVQLFGSNAKVMGAAAKKVVDLYKVPFIDINMGCPVPKVAIKNGAGSALLKDLNKVKEIVSTVVSAVSVPVTVKIRSGWDSEHINAVSVAKICEEAGASAIAIHGRTRAQGYSGCANWNIIKDVKDNVRIPVIGNGDIKTIFDAKRMFDETGCDAIMIGRATLGNPWIFRECFEYLNCGNVLKMSSFDDRIDMIKEHYFLLKKYCSEKKALLEIRTHVLWYIKGIPGVKEFKNRLTVCDSEKCFFELLEDIGGLFHKDY